MRLGFDNDKYVREQSKEIRRRAEKYGKLYLEFGGKLFDDLHAARVLPGFEADAKIKLLCELKDITEIIFCISAPAIEKNKIRADIGITYDMDVLRLVRNISAMGLSINSVVITQYSEQPAARQFEKKLQALGIRTYIHSLTRGYPSDVATILSDEGYGANPFIETSKPLVVVTAPGPGSGKLATCLSQIYHENKRGVKAGYAKFETFPIWNLPLKHPVNLAYEAATADLHDVNTIDPYHFEKYGEVTVNYNRDIEADVFSIFKIPPPAPGLLAFSCRASFIRSTRLSCSAISGSRFSPTTRFARYSSSLMPSSVTCISHDSIRGKPLSPSGLKPAPTLNPPL